MSGSTISPRVTAIDFMDNPTRHFPDILYNRDPDALVTALDAFVCAPKPILQAFIKLNRVTIKMKMDIILFY